MTSVAVISSVVARIESLQRKDFEWWTAEAGVMKSLIETKEQLLAAYDRQLEEGEKFVVVEKEIVQLSYEIFDAITDASSFKPPKEKFSLTTCKLTRGKKSVNEQLQEAESKVNDLLSELREVISEESRTASSGSEMKAGRGLNPNKSDDSELIQEQGDKEEEEEDVLNRIREELLNPKSSSSEVYLVGESGMGKTSMARRLCSDILLRRHFKFFGWVPINHNNFQIKRVLRDVLQQMGTVREQQAELLKMNEVELISRIFDVLKDKMYLLVLDDIKAVDEWESIFLALPTANSSRVIITTSSPEIVAAGASCYRIGFTQTEILDLLKTEASLLLQPEKVGKAIFDISGGSPLFATILGRSIQSETNEQQLVDEIHSHLPHKGTPRVLGVCYRRLGPETKACLLYMAQFPQGNDIQVDKLYQLLAAENLIITSSPQSLREILDELAYRKFVQAQGDHIKSCRLHHPVWDFCKIKASEEEFLEIVDSGQVGHRTRRLALHLRGDSKSLPLFIRQSTMKKLLTLVIIDTFDKKLGWPSEFNDLKDLRYLRILSFDGVDFRFRKFPKGLDKLLVLRYLSFRGCFLEELPSSLSSLTQLETLDLLVQDDCCMIIANNIFTSMKRMLHLYLPKLCQGTGMTKKLISLQGLEMMETLVNFDTEVFDVEALLHLTNLKILSTVSKGDVQDLDIVVNFFNERAHRLHHVSVDITRFNYYNKNSASVLKKLLRCQFVHSLRIEGLIVELQEEENDGSCCGEGVSEMAFDSSLLEHNPMPYLGKFQNLRSLLLSNDAFLGVQLLISAAALFPNLRNLKLQNLRYLQELEIEEGALTKLSTLQIDSCGGLLKITIPSSLYNRLLNGIGGNGFLPTPWPPRLRIRASKTQF